MFLKYPFRISKNWIMNQKTMWEADEIAQARIRIILRVYILTTHPLFHRAFSFYQIYFQGRNRNTPWSVSLHCPLLQESTGPLSLFFLWTWSSWFRLSGSVFVSRITSTLEICIWILPLWLCPSSCVHTIVWCPGKHLDANSMPSSCARSGVSPHSVWSFGSKLRM